MKYLRYSFGLITGLLVVYLFGAIVSWDLDPGKWNGFWRFLCTFFSILWAHLFGLFFKDRPWRKGG